MNMITTTSFDNALWRKSSRSLGVSNCIEVAMNSGSIGVRDSQNPDKKTLNFSSHQWRGLIQAVTHEKFNL